MEKNTSVIPESLTGAGSEPAPTPSVVNVVAEPLDPQKPPKGFVPYQALDEERTLRKAAETELEKLRTAPSEEPDEVFSDEGKALKGEIKALNERIRLNERKEARREAEIEFPFLLDKREEFNAFLEEEENKRISVRKLAKLFAAEHQMLASEPHRKGLEKPTGGGQVVPEPTLSAEDIRHLMKNDYRKFEALVKAGKI